MLVLSRRIGEQLRIGDDIVVVVSAISKNRVRIAIDAPQTTVVLRGELHPIGDHPPISKRRRVPKAMLPLQPISTSN